MISRLLSILHAIQDARTCAVDREPAVASAHRRIQRHRKGKLGMMIFDNFKDSAQLEPFRVAAQQVTKQYIDEPSVIVNNWEEFEKYDVFPYELVFPCVLVPRLDSMKEEARIEKLVEKLGGEFAGT